ncbi:MAG: hypothetical protein Q9191_005507 [Dirinaria sp. TL-2023a]
MHILVTNDDGPPSQQSSPYVHSFVKILQEAGNTVSVILPHQQRSWIGKAHFVGQVTKPSYFRPGTLHKDDGTTHERPAQPNEIAEEWVLVDGTPASCAQLGLYHFFQDRGPVDLVVSGPNYGRNSTSLFSLSSGTVGGAMEAAVCGKRSIALSFAFYSRDHDPKLIAGASRHAVRVIEHLYNNWAADVDLYSINIPLIAEVESHPTLYTNALQNYWTSGSSFEEIPASEGDQVPEIHEKEIREDSQFRTSVNAAVGHRHRHFKWAPKFGDIQKSVDASSPGNDGWALSQGFSSVTPLKANFMHSSSTVLGELKLSSSLEIPLLADPPPTSRKVYAFIDYEDNYVQPLLLEALKNQLPQTSIHIVTSIPKDLDPSALLIQIVQYEAIDFEYLLSRHNILVNAYITRKALIRKHYLANTVSSWFSKHPRSLLQLHVKPTLDFDLDYAEFLDDALLEAYELHESFARNANVAPEEREWWILKPSMSDRGQGVRLFSSESALRSIFEEWEAEAPGSEGSEDEEDDPIVPSEKDGIMTSHLRHFVVQPYIDPPRLFPELQNRKFHLRSYVLAVGALRVYVAQEMLALFASRPYCPPSASTDRDIHLTNTCLQDPATVANINNDSVHLLSKLPLSAAEQWSIRDQISAATGELFEAAARGQMLYFQTLPNAFEIFGVDWLVDKDGRCWLLEVNAFPDFQQSGVEGKGVVKGVWEAAVGIAVGGFLGAGEGGQAHREADKDEKRWGMRKVLDIDLGRR